MEMRILMSGGDGIVSEGLRLVLKDTWPKCRLIEFEGIGKEGGLTVRQDIDLAILETGMGGSTTLEEAVRSVSERAKVVVLAPYERESIETERLRNAGASRVIFRDTSLEEIRAVLLSIFALGTAII